MMFEKILSNKLTKHLKDFKEAWGLIIFFVAFIAAPLKPNLVVLVRSEALAQTLVVRDISKAKSEKLDISQGGKTLLTVELINRTSEMIEAVELSVNGVSEFIAAGISSTSSRVNAENSNYSQAIARNSRTYFFPNIKTIPPNHSIRLQIAGDFEQNFFFQDRVTITSSAKSTKVMQTTSVWGLISFIHEYEEVILAIILTVLLGIGLSRVYKEENAN